MEPLVRLEFENFQSLKSTFINLDPGFTVIVGPSNLGKSAAIRALKALARNAAAPGLVRDGAKEMNITALFKDGDCVELTKGKNKSEFRLNGELFAKAGANAAPEAVSDLWALPAPESREICFAGQHDKPFLLDEPASAVAKVLGDLTNASLLMAAVAQANKLRTAALADEKARQREADEARDELLTHQGLSARATAVQAARAAFTAANEAVAQWQKLTALQKQYEELSAQISQAREIVASTTNLEQTLERAVSTVDRLRALERLRDERAKLSKQIDETQATIAWQATAKRQAETEIDDLLDQAGQCPLCNQRIN